ncbi:hypothetical protein F4808DRAFT_394006 [Astrocystis sublimbata]|nr:hypothetical protein F4808DRAFT_394006 [Astrocystis sublimbata]
MSSSISRLPDSAKRLISSHAVIVTPVILVKELLDNAIDARAASVEVLISPDTVSKIGVRDDGVGIHPNDYDALGKRGHTSKLRTIDELPSVVGKSLGFRGEALASVNSMADVTIITKIATEPVAAVLRLKSHQGGILTHKPVSAPVGTTVSVTNLFSHQPVRRQVATKDAKKTLEKIQELLRSYAMARPRLRLMFKVLQTPTKAWSYSPKGNATSSEAALQLFGVDMTSSCLLKTFQTGNASPDAKPTVNKCSQASNDNIQFEALLANPSVDLHRVPKRHYLSVDGRPINAGRGIAKRLLSIYMEHLKSSTLLNDVSDCFIRLDITCPPGSYDANIEPSKDNVLFSDEQVVLEAFRHLCNGVYKPAAVDKSPLHGARELNTQSTSTSCSPESAQESPQVHVNLPPRDQISPINEVCTTDEMVCDPTSEEIRPNAFLPINGKDIRNHLRQESNPHMQNRWMVDMSVDLHGRPKPNHQRSHKGMPVSPPSLEATTMAANRGHQIFDRLEPLEVAKTSSSSPLTSASTDPATHYPNVSPLTPEPPILRHTMAPPGDLDMPRSHEDATHAKTFNAPRSTVPGGPYRSPLSSPLAGGARGSHLAVVDRSQAHGGRRRHREHLPWTPPSSIEIDPRSKMNEVNLAHVQDDGGFKQTQISFKGGQAGQRQHGVQKEASRRKNGSNISINELEANGHLDVQDIFSKAKENLNYQLSHMDNDQPTKAVPSRGLQRHQQQQPRQRKPFATLDTNSFVNNEGHETHQEPIATTLPTGDPRAYLSRRQKSAAAEECGARPRKLRRVKSSLMPFENITPENDTHSLSLIIRIDTSIIDEQIRTVREYDEYLIYGTLFEGIDMSLDEGKSVESKLQKLLIEQKENIAGDDTDSEQIIINVQAALKGKGVANPSET